LINSIILSRIEQDDIGRYLTIEILESEKIQNFDIINEFIQEVKNHGVSIAIDDFGTGFSNYEFIVQLNVDYLKIDGSLIKKIDEDIYMNVIKSIIMLCREQNIKIVAEFVSDLKTQRYVKSLEIDYSQGYYIQKPKSIEQISGENSEK
jgi:EAL domain-containing protein (putative c-di-GMP-specific phosphodiesterase class I)